MLISVVILFCFIFFEIIQAQGIWGGGSVLLQFFVGIIFIFLNSFKLFLICC